MQAVFRCPSDRIENEVRRFDKLALALPMAHPVVEPDLPAVFKAYRLILRVRRMGKRSRDADGAGGTLTAIAFVYTRVALNIMGHR